MPTIKHISSYIIIALTAIIIISWGKTGHQHIALNAQISFNTEMIPFVDWVAYISEHSSDADARKSIDENEGVRHYIDIDNYTEFTTTGAISPYWDSVISLHGSSFVVNNGTLPWTTIQTYDSLVQCLMRKDWEKSKYFAADLSHYVADGFMPLHLTNNYNGQNTNNYGIHSRYESTMLNDHINEINFASGTTDTIGNISNFVFNYIYVNYKMIDSILEADNYAKSISSNTSSTDYKNALWQKSKGFTQVLLSNASQAFARLLYNAWMDAGKPNLNATSTDAIENSVSISVFPNPSVNVLNIGVNNTDNHYLSVRIYNIKGELISILTPENFEASSFNYVWNIPESILGIHFIRVTTRQGVFIKKVIINN